MADDWSRFEVEALVADHFTMLAKELRDEDYNKTSHRRALAPLLNNRSDGSIERKHQNVSAILIEFGYPYISGYKPLVNYQRLLLEVVSDRVQLDKELVNTVQTSVQLPAETPAVRDLLSRWEEPPEPVERAAAYQTRERPRPSSPVNWLELEARNSSLGLAGETFVLSFERERLLHAGKTALADRVDHVSILSEGEGFDIRSFETNGKDRFIEVKTTAYGKQVPFFLTRNELNVSRERSTSYHLYRLFQFRKDPRLYGLSGALDQCCDLDPVQYSARVK